MAAKVPVRAAPAAGLVHDRRAGARVFDPRLIPWLPGACWGAVFQGIFQLRMR
jgi:hypothetical protein